MRKANSGGKNFRKRKRLKEEELNTAASDASTSGIKQPKSAPSRTKADWKIERKCSECSAYNSADEKKRVESKWFFESTSEERLEKA